MGLYEMFGNASNVGEFRKIRKIIISHGSSHRVIEFFAFKSSPGHFFLNFYRIRPNVFIFTGSRNSEIFCTGSGLTGSLTRGDPIAPNKDCLKQSSH